MAVGAMLWGAAAIIPSVAHAAEDGAEKAPSQSVEMEIAEGILGHTWGEWGVAGAIVGGAILMSKLIGVAIKQLDSGSDEFSRRARIAANGFRWARRLLWGGSVFAGLKVLGVDFNNLLMGSGILAAAIAFSVKDITNNIGAYIGIRNRGEVEVGDLIVVKGVSGVIRRINLLSIVIEGVDENGTRHEYYIPPPMILSEVTEKIILDEETLGKINIGDYISVGGKITGKVACITDQTIGIEQENANGIRYVRHIQKYTISEHSLVNHGTEPPKLPGGLEIGSKISFADGTAGVVSGYDEAYVWIDTADGKRRIPRSELSRT